MPTKKPSSQLGRRLASWFHPHLLQIADCRLRDAISNLQSPNLLCAITGATRAFILADGVQKAARRWYSPGPWPGALAVGGAPSLKAVAGLLVLVNGLVYTVKVVFNQTPFVAAIIPRGDAACQVGRATDCACTASLCYNGLNGGPMPSMYLCGGTPDELC
jgi:hypothetical protein